MIITIGSCPEPAIKIGGQLSGQKSIRSKVNGVSIFKYGEDAIKLLIYVFFMVEVRNCPHR